LSYVHHKGGKEVVRPAPARRALVGLATDGILFGFQSIPAGAGSPRRGLGCGLGSETEGLETTKAQLLLGAGPSVVVW